MKVRSSYAPALCVASMVCLLAMASNRAARAQDYSIIFDTVGSFIDVPSSPPDFGGFDFGRGDFGGRYFDGGSYGGGDYYGGSRRNSGRYGRSYAAEVPANYVPEPTVEPAANSTYKITSYGLTTAEIQAAQASVRMQNADVVAELARQMPNELSLVAEIEGATFATALRGKLFTATQSGDVEGLAALFLDALCGGTPADRDALVEMATARRQIERMLGRANAGTLDDGYLRYSAALIVPVMNESGAEFETIAETLRENSEIIALLSEATPGAEAVPTGDDVAIIYSTALAGETVVTLGERAVIVSADGRELESRLETGNAYRAAGAPMGEGTVVADSDREEMRDGVYLKNPTGSAISYVLNDRYTYTIESGHVQRLPGNRKWSIAFDRGGSYGEARYSLDGSYEFRATDRGFDVVKVTFSTTVENAAGVETFHYVLNNKPHELAGGETRTHDDLTYPPVIRFDDGLGTVKTKALRDAAFRVQIAEANHGLELFTDAALAGDSELARESGRVDAAQLFGGGR